MFVHEQFKLPQLIQCGFLQTIKNRNLVSEQNINVKYYENRTAIHIAVISNQILIVKQLMGFKPDLNLKDSLGLTVIDWIFKKNNQKIFQNILDELPSNIKQPKNEFNQSINILQAAQISLFQVQQICQTSNPFQKDEFGRKALHRAAIAGNLQTFLYLLTKKFDPLVQDCFGFNSYHYLMHNPANPISQHYKLLANDRKCQTHCQGQNYSDVIIIGSGASGIGAAMTLSRKGVPFRILEARDRIGGRIFSVSMDEVQVDLGACWVHSYSKNNPICKQVKILGWKSKSAQQREESIIKSNMVQNYKHKDIEQCQRIYSHYLAVVKKKAIQSNEDISIEAAGRQFYEKNILTLPKHKKASVDMFINMTEHYEASNISDLSAKFYQERQDYGADFSPEGSYSILLKTIANSQKIQNKIKFNTEVVLINYQKQLCEVISKNGQVYKAKKVISSLPLGVLKTNQIKFLPQLPQQRRQIIQKMGWGVMNKIILSFEKPFWKGNPGWIRLACQQKGKFPAIVNFSSKNKHILCCFITDNFALKISKLTDDQILQELMQLFEKAFKTNKIWPKAYVITRWDQEDYSLGSYSHFGVGTNIQSTKKLRKNIDGKLWIIGQHCYGEHIGCAHGAYQTGIWAAQEIISEFKETKYQIK